MEKSDFNLSFDKFMSKVVSKFKKFAWGKVEIKNNCDLKEGKINLSPTQKFVSEYFNKNNPNGILLYHSVGSGKTLTSVKLVSEFEKEGFNAIWVTRTTLKKDLEKAILMNPIKKTLPVFSYKQFSNICKRKGENFNKLMERARKINPKTDDPLYKTIIIIDEVHKLYTKDLKAQEMHDMSAIQKCVYSSYEKSGENRARVVLMSATPITTDPIEVVKLLNLIITKPDDRFNEPTFKIKYLDNGGQFTKSGDHLFSQKIKGIVSYVNISSDPSRFAQVSYHNVLVPVSTPESINSDRANMSDCETGFRNCKKIGIQDKECVNARKRCIARNKKLPKISVDQLTLLNKKCGLEI